MRVLRLILDAPGEFVVDAKADPMGPDSLVRKAGLPKATVAAHVKALRRVGLVLPARYRLPQHSDGSYRRSQLVDPCGLQIQRVLLPEGSVTSVPLTRREIARKMGVSETQGSFTRALGDLVERGTLSSPLELWPSRAAREKYGSPDGVYWAPDDLLDDEEAAA